MVAARGLFWVGLIVGCRGDDGLLLCDASRPALGGRQVWYPDLDGDGYGSAVGAVEQCVGPEGFVADGGDCDDTDARTYPGAPETCDLEDNDCDGRVPVTEVDQDGDGQTPVACGGDDCDDTDATAYRGGEEVCDDGIDNDCVFGDEACVLTFTGIRTDLELSELAGWDRCHVDTFSDVSSIGAIRGSCDGANLLVACRVAGSDVLTVAAHAPRDDVFFETGTGNDLHVANEVGWYFDENWSWGFANPEDSVNRTSCDTVMDVRPEERLCFHTSGGLVASGYRCGAVPGLTSSYASDLWERVVFQADF
jgi:hypothetical protein